MRILSKISSLFAYLIQRLFFLLEFFLFLRLMLKFFNANPKTPVVASIYQYSDIFVSPFEFIFPDIFWPEGRLIEISTIAAMIGYAILVFIISQFLKALSGD